MDPSVDYVRFGAALVAVIALIGLLAWVARRTGFGGGAVARAGRARRLGLVEVLTLDAKYRLVLVRRDDVEHTLVLGPDGARVIERGVARTPAPAPLGRPEPSP